MDEVDAIMKIKQEDLLQEKSGKEGSEYKALMEARTASDNDEELQKQIGEFNLVRMKMEIESGKPEPDQNKINELNEQLMSIYTQVMESENMVAFNKAKDVVDHLMNHVTAILTAAVNGEDPDTYDPDAAKAVLEEAGWVDTDGDGIREKDGTKLVIRWLTYPSRQELPLLAESAQASLKQIGIDVDINCTANRRQFLADMTSWDIYASALVTAPSGDPQYFFTTSCLPGMSYNFGAYENEHVNELIEELSKEFDTEKRAQLAIELQQAILDDNAYVFCSFLQMNMISKANVSNWTAHACDYYEVTVDLDID